MLLGTHAVAAVRGVQPQTPATPPPPQLLTPVQVQFSVPPQPSVTLPQWVPSQALGVQHCEVAVSHSMPPVHEQLTLPPQPSPNFPHIPAYLPVQVHGVQQAAPLQTSPGWQPQVMVLPQPSAMRPQVPGATLPQAAGVQQVFVSWSQTSPAMPQGQSIVPP
jgi:hypothetical protein